MNTILYWAFLSRYMRFAFKINVVNISLSADVLWGSFVTHSVNIRSSLFREFYFILISKLLTRLFDF